MKQRGRKPAVLGAVAPVIARRLDPPDDLNAAESAIWRRIVASRPAGYFEAGDAELLRAFCAASGFFEAACRDVRERGVLVANDKGVLVKNPALGAVANLSSSMKALGTALRLTQQSRYGPRVAARQTAAAARPWEPAG